MQTKPHRLLKWTLLACVSLSLASACVVKTGSGDDDDDFFNGGDGGTKSGTAGKAGSSSTAGKGGTTTTTGGGGSGTTAGSSSVGGDGGAGGGGTGSTYAPGVCDASAPDAAEGPTPTKLADTTPKSSDDDCLKCLKDKCATEWSTCYGTKPSIACGWGPSENDQDGQFDCILGCFFDGAKDPMGTADELLSDCSAMCTNQCDAEDNGNVMIHTSDLVTCANDPGNCQTECFPF
jgi:hypothetical protein